MTIWKLLEEPAPDGCHGIQDLYSWSLNFDSGKGPFSLFCDLIGWSHDELGPLGSIPDSEATGTPETPDMPNPEDRYFGPQCGNCGARGHWADQCESSRAPRPSPVVEAGPLGSIPDSEATGTPETPDMPNPEDRYLGEALYRGDYPLGWIEADKLARALTEWADRPSDVREYVEQLIAAEMES